MPDPGLVARSLVLLPGTSWPQGRQMARVSKRKERI